MQSANERNERFQPAEARDALEAAAREIADTVDEPDHVPPDSFAWILAIMHKHELRGPGVIDDMQTALRVLDDHDMYEEAGKLRRRARTTEEDR